MKSKLIVMQTAIFMIVSISLCQTSEQKAARFIDPRNNNAYRWVKIGKQV
jgi:hypothetical protein